MNNLSTKLRSKKDANEIKLKVLFIYVVVILSFIVILILVFYDLSSRIDYILEWNYFLGLLFYYLLSSVMLKKIKTNVSA